MKIKKKISIEALGGRSLSNIWESKEKNTIYDEFISQRAFNDGDCESIRKLMLSSLYNLSVQTLL